ncbi:hypothetical protein VE02_04625 [Pseudogymnoascus sp. 03VT05]|nr:hypothetical protein VE02_04625 [Pseudogymnoascus sp. 03VT05]
MPAARNDSTLKFFLVDLFSTLSISAVPEHSWPKHPDALPTKDSLVLPETFSSKLLLKLLNRFRLDIWPEERNGAPASASTGEFRPPDTVAPQPRNEIVVHQR